jgi:hypothetical protein
VFLDHCFGSSVIAGNYLGVDSSGLRSLGTSTTPSANIRLIAGFGGNRIGGATPIDRNIISGAWGQNISIQGVDGIR